LLSQQHIFTWKERTSQTVSSEVSQLANCFIETCYFNIHAKYERVCHTPWPLFRSYGNKCLQNRTAQ